MEKTGKNKKEIAKTTNPEVDVELTEKDLEKVSGGTKNPIDVEKIIKPSPTFPKR